MNRLTTPAWMLGACAALALTACGGGTPADAIGGTVSGLAAGATVGLEENNSTVLSVSGNAGFEFPGPLPANTPYVVTVASQPAGETCSVANGSGTMDANGDPIDNVAVNCVAGTTVGGTVSGLPAGASLTLSDGNSTLAVAANGNFAFTDLYPNAAVYAVSVAAQPSGELCTVANGAGAVDANGDAVSSVTVTCAAAPALSGTVAGLAPNATVLLTDGGSQQLVSGSGPYAFTDTFAPGAIYQVSVVTQPVGQTCAVANATGTFDGNGDPINNVSVTCTTNGTVGGMVSGLAAGATLTLTDGSTTLAVTANGGFVFSDLYAAGAPYAVSVTGQPSGQTCTIVGGTGLGNLDAGDDAVTSVNITCM
jgi:hypothetical protein